MRAARYSESCSTVNYTTLSHPCFVHWNTVVRFVVGRKSTQDELSQLLKTLQRITESPPTFEQSMKLFNQSTELRLGIQVVEYRCFILIKSLGENKNPSSLENVFFVICLQYYDFSYTVLMYKNEDVLSTGFQQF